MKYVFIVNPAAGKGNIQPEVVKSVKKYFTENGGRYSILTTGERGDARAMAESEAATGEEMKIFACGGEGTCFEVINGAFGYSNASVGVIPCGSANDFLRYFGSHSAFRSIEKQIHGTDMKVDLIKAGEDYCLNGCSVGMDAMVADEMHNYKRLPLITGSFAYKLAIAKVFTRHLGVRLTLTVDGETSERDCLFAVIANAPYYGGGYMGAPDAVPDDGELDFTCVSTLGRVQIPKFLALYRNGKHKGLDYCDVRRCSEMSFTSATPIPVNLDGEIIHTKQMSFKLVKSCANFVVPEGISVRLLTNV